ncbi:MAG TPA: GNAT family N-acetyltransferase [Acidimicrobiia bacterium]
MTDRIRHRYLIDLDGWIISGTDPARGEIRSPSLEDADGLSQLMLDAYVGTIDYDGENLADARVEVDEYFSSEPLLECSRVVEIGGELAAAALLTLWDGAPLIGYVMTRSLRKGQGLARVVLVSALDCLARTSNRQVHAFITEGNTASERLFASLGAVLHD